MIIRNMLKEDIDFAFNRTKEEGWLSETREVFENFFLYDPCGCFIAEENGINIGMCVATKYKQNGFIGELIVIKDKRGMGIGSQILEHSINYLKECGIKNIFLDGDLDAAPLYERFGFRKICESRRFIGIIKGRSFQHVERPTNEDISSIVEIDREVFGDDRAFFIKQKYLNHPDLCRIVKKNGKIVSYLFAQPGLDIISVGPWGVIDFVEKPTELIEDFAFKIGSKTIRIGVLENNIQAIRTIESIGSLKISQPSWRMLLGTEDYLGKDERLYAIGSPATG